MTQDPHYSTTYLKPQLLQHSNFTQIPVKQTTHYTYSQLSKEFYPNNLMINHTFKPNSISALNVLKKSVN